MATIAASGGKSFARCELIGGFGRDQFPVGILRGDLAREGARAIEHRNTDKDHNDHKDEEYEPQ